MKKRLALAIQNLVEAMDSTWEKSHYVCAIEPRFRTLKTDDYKLYLMSRDDYSFEVIELSALVMAIDPLCNHISYNLSTYDMGTTEPKIIKAICIE